MMLKRATNMLKRVTIVLKRVTIVYKRATMMKRVKALSAGPSSPYSRHQPIQAKPSLALPLPSSGEHLVLI